MTSLFSLNESAAQAFTEIGDYLQIKGENPFKIKAYTKAARVLRELDEDLEQLCQRGELRSIDGVGKAIGDKLESFITTGSIPQLEALREEVPVGLLEVASIKGLGAKKASQLHQELGVVDLDGLQAALVEGKVAELKGFTKKSQAKFLALVEKAMASETTFIKSRLEQWATQVASQIESLKALRSVNLVGAVRRKEPQSASLELLLSCESVDVVRRGLTERFQDGGTRFQDQGHLMTLEHPSGCPVHLHLVGDDKFAWEYLRLTGPPEFVAAYCQRAKLDPATSTAREEAALFEQCGLQWIPPELRHRAGPWELEVTLLELDDIKGNLHAHTLDSDGEHSLEDMVGEALARGHSYFGVTDHSRSLVVANGLTEDRLEAQIKRVAELNREMDGIRVFSANECDILTDGSLDYSDQLLNKLDYIVVAVHSFFHLTPEQMTDRLLAGLQHPKAKILAHPTGRLLTRRDGYQADWRTVFQACCDQGVAVEINSSPWRLDISEELLDLAVECDCLISINTDAHSKKEFDSLVHGVDMARRGALDPSRVINTWEVEKLETWFAGGL